MSIREYIIHFQGRELRCPEGMNLRSFLLQSGLSPHNGAARQINCKGLGSCGTCALEIEGEVSEKTAMERWRLNFPPHQESSGLRLACQCKVRGDLKLRKHPGFWGQHVPREE